MTVHIVPPHDLQRGHRIVGWTGDDGHVDIADDRGNWTVDGVIVRPEDAPSYRRHRHGYVQVLFADARIDLPEMAPVVIDRPEVN